MCLSDLPKHTSLTLPPPTLPLIHTLDPVLFLKFFRDTPILRPLATAIPRFGTLFLQICAWPTPSPLTSHLLQSLLPCYLLMRSSLTKLLKSQLCPPSLLYLLFSSIALIIFPYAIIRVPTYRGLPRTFLALASKVPHPGNPLGPEQIRMLVNLTIIYYFYFLSLLMIHKITSTEQGSVTAVFTQNSAGT